MSVKKIIYIKFKYLKLNLDMNKVVLLRMFFAVVKLP